MSTLDSPNIQWPSEHGYLVGDRGTMALGVALTNEIPEQLIATEDFETDPISGFGSWVLDLTNPHSGLRCLQSDVITDSQTIDYTFTVPVGATSVRFWYRVSSEFGFDFFQVITDFFTVVFQDSGPGNIWTQKTLDVTGATSVTFRYSKDSSTADGLDLAAIDDIEWIVPLVPSQEIYAPFRLTPDKQCIYVELCDNTVEVSGTVDTRFLDCDTDSVTVCPPVSGFEVVVTPGPCPIPIIAAECIPVNVRLDCATDSISICALETIPVELTGPVSGTFEQRPLSCDLDSVSICVSGTIPVTFNEPIAVTLDEPIAVTLDEPIAITTTARTATLNNGVETAVSSSAVQVAAANSNRKSIIIQNTGSGAVRIGTTGVTATTGFRLISGGHIIFTTEDIPTNAIYAIREGAVDSIVMAQEVV